jgi:hypothetical protein
MADPKRKRGCGCVVLGVIAVGILIFVMIPAGFLGVRLARRQINRFTDLQPAVLPKAALTEAELGAVLDRVSAFRKALDEGRAVEPLALTAGEINGLIAADPDLRIFRDRLHVTIAGDTMTAQLAMPAEQAGLERLRGRFLNASGTVLLLIRDNAPFVSLDSLSKNGAPLPETLMRAIRVCNLAESATTDPRARAEFAKIQEMRVRDRKLVIIAKPAATLEK